MQYTIRQIPHFVDRLFRQRARETGKSLNEVVVQALKMQTGTHGEPTVYHDLDKLIGSWENDPEFDAAVKTQEKIDRSLWK